MKPFSLPAGWEIKLFGQCIKKVKYTEKQPTKSFLPEGKFPIVSQEKELISGYSNNQNAVFSVKNPVVIFGDHTKVVKYIDFDFVIGADGVKILQPIEDINAKYFYYYLSHLHLRDLGYARHYKLLKECIVIYPPLPEQKRIVEKLDKIFAAIDKAKSQTEKNLQNAKDVFNSCLNNIFNHPNWEEKTLGELCHSILDGDWIESKDQAQAGIRLIQTGNIGVGVFLNKEQKSRFISEATFDRLHCTEVFPGDCLVSRLPDPIGRSCLVPSLPGRMITAVDCSILRFNENKILPQYFIYYTFRSQYFHSVSEESTGTTRKRISRKKLMNIQITLPLLSEQKRIVEKLDLLQSKTQELEKIYTQKLADLEELKQAVLQQAFSGKL